MYDLVNFKREDEAQCLNSLLFIGTVYIVGFDEAKQRSVMRIMLTNWKWNHTVAAISRSELIFRSLVTCRLRLKCDGTRVETRLVLSAKRTNPFKSGGGGGWGQSNNGNRGVRISGSNAGYTMFRGSVKGTGYLLHSPVSSSFPLPCVTVCRHISTVACMSCKCQKHCKNMWFIEGFKYLTLQLKYVCSRTQNGCQ